MKPKYLFFLIFIVLLSSCLKAPVELIIDGTAIVKPVTPLPISGRIVFVQGNDIYMLDSMNYSNPKRLTNTPAIGKSDVKLSYDRRKILYTELNVPVVIDTNGIELNRYNAYSDALSYWWAGNNSTIIVGNQYNVQQIGTPVLNQNLPSYYIFGNSYYNFIAVSKTNDVFYSTWTSFGDYNTLDYYTPGKASANDVLPGDRYTTKSTFSADGSVLLHAEPTSLGNPDRGAVSVYNISNTISAAFYHNEPYANVQDVCIGPDNKKLLFTYSEPVSGKYYFTLYDSDYESSKTFFNTTAPITSLDWK